MNIQEQNKYKILLGCPVSSPRSWILPYYLQHILDIDFDKKSIILYFLANNIQDNSLKILKQFQKDNKNKYIDIIIEIKNSPKFFQDERDTKTRESMTYSWLSTLRNTILKKTVQLNCTHLMSIDCDILVKSSILKKLLSANRPIISSLIYNGYLYASLEEAYKYPNILRKEANGTYSHIVNYHVKYPESNPENTVIEVSATGACILMTKEVCEKTQYQWHKQGEDMYHAEDAYKKGFQSYCMLDCYSQHIMSENFLDIFKDF